MKCVFDTSHLFLEVRQFETVCPYPGSSFIVPFFFFNKEMRNTGRIARSVSRRAASAKTSERRKESVPLHVVSRCFPR